MARNTRKLIVVLAMIVGIVGVCLAAGGTGVYVGEEIKGDLKYCKYNDGSIITIRSYEVCPRIY